MYIWKTGKLVAELSKGEMTQWEMAQYLIATTVVWYIFGGVYYDPSDIEISERYQQIACGLRLFMK